MSNEKQEFPRRNRIDLFSEAEKAIYDAQQAVERAGADPRLTKATILLSEARSAVADFVDGVESKLTPHSVDGEWIRVHKGRANYANGNGLSDGEYLIARREGSAPQEPKQDEII